MSRQACRHAALPVLLLLFSLFQLANCQTTPQGYVASPTPTPTRGPYSPAPYQPDEFSQELQDLRRGEVITLGAIPITYLFSSLLYDVGRYLWLEANSDASATGYFTGSGYQYSNNGTTKTYKTGQFDTDETVGLLLSSTAIGLIIAVVDNILLTDERSRAKIEEERIRLLREERERNLLLGGQQPTGQPASDAQPTTPAPVPADLPGMTPGPAEEASDGR